MPYTCAALHWRNVAAILVIARKAEAHRHNCDTARIIELVPRHAHPIAQTGTGWIIERDARRIGEITRRLPDNENTRRRRDLKDRVGRTLHVCFA